MSRKQEMPPIAVTGVGALFPGDGGSDGFWKTIFKGRDCIGDVPAGHWLIDDYYDPDPTAPGKTYTRRGAFLPPVDFDPIEYGIPPTVLPSTDTAQLLALIVARRVLESCRFDRMDKDRIAVILGVASATELVSTMSGSLQRPLIEKVLGASGLPQDQINTISDRISQCYVDWTESTFPGLLGNVVAGRIANRFDLGGTNCVIDAACASSLGAMKMAVDELWTGSADMVITGGVDAINDIFMYMCFSKTLAMSRTEDCRPFSGDADGTMLGEGIGLFAFRRLEDAERDGDLIYAVIRGIGGSSDGRAKSIYAPRHEGQAKALRRAYQAAGYSPATVELMEAHGTGTVAGDAAEIAALKEVFGEARQFATPWCALGSIKSQVGHTKAAAGSASLYKAVMALHHRVLPPTLKIREPNPSLGLTGSPFYLNTESRPWIHSGDYPRRASVSSFGFGGSNFHLTLEEYKGMARPLRIRTVPTELFLFSADHLGALLEQARAAAQSAAKPGGFGATAFATQAAFTSFAQHRLAVVAADAADLSAKLERAADKIQKGETSFCVPMACTYASVKPTPGKTAFLFPGQGSQYLGMTEGLTLAFDEALHHWDSDADVASVVFPQPAFNPESKAEQLARLTDTRLAQPAIGIASRIYLSMLDSAGVKPDLCAGHSFGEVTALFCAGVVSESDFLRVARKRGNLMADAAATLPGAMAAVVASRTEIEGELTALGPDIVIANINSPRQVVLAGPTVQIEEAVKRLNARGKIARLLPVSTAFHSKIVESAAIPFTSFLEEIDFNPPQMPVYSNSTAQVYLTVDNARSLLGFQLARPVRFEEEIAALYAAGARNFIEVGPGSVLTELVDACLDGQPHQAIAVDAKGQNAVTALWYAFAKFAAGGVPFSTAFAWKNYCTESEAPTGKTSATVFISGANFAKKYPAEIAPFALPEQRTDTTVIHQLEGNRSSSIQLIQEKMAEAHAAAQRAMAESHLAYLKASELMLSSILNGQPPLQAPKADALLISPPQPAVMTRVEASAPSPIEKQLVKNISHDGTGLEELVLSVIADQTGYPVDILTADMDLEADLGIDSIKRVQILAAVSERRPDLPAVEPSAISGVRTIGSVIAHLNGEGNRVERPGSKSPLLRIGLQQVSAPPAPSTQSLFGRGDMFAIVGCSDGVGGSLARVLGEHGVDAKVMPAVPSEARGTVFLDLEDDGSEDIVSHATRVFNVVKGFTASAGVEGGSLVMVQARGNVWRTGITALAKTVALEHVNCAVRTIEIDRGKRSPAEIASIIANEIVTPGGADPLLVDEAGERSVLREVERPIAGKTDADLLGGKPVIVASGGARGVTAACLIAAAQIAPFRVALLGRTQLVSEPDGLAHITDAGTLKAALLASARARGEVPTPLQLESSARSILACREIHRTLESLRKAGSEAIYLVVDVTDEAAVENVISDVRGRWKQVDMLIHGAGIVADKRIAEKSPEQFAAVFATKVLGLKSLLHATRTDLLRFICVFSSVAGRYGNAGQADYAMANAALNQIAKQEALCRGPQCVVRSLNWGPWDGGMVGPELRQRFAAKGIAVIPMQDGVEAFVRELQHRSADPADVDVVLAAKA